MKKILGIIAAALALLGCPALGQVRQSGNVTPTHAACWTTNGIVQDCGSAAIPYLTTLGTVGSGQTICANSGPVSSAYNQLCLGATQTGGGVVSLFNYNGASGGLTFNINGTIYNPANGSFEPQAANTFLAGPESGSAATPSFRIIVNNDLSSITELPSSVTIPSPTLSGTVTFPDSGTATSSGLNSIAAIGVGETAPSSGNVNISGLYEIGGTQIGYGHGLTGFGTAAAQNTGTSGATIGFLNGNNTYSGNDTFSGSVTFSDVSSVTCDFALVINSGGTLGTGNCPGVASSIDASGASGATTVSNATAGNCLYVNSSSDYLANQQCGNLSPQGRLTLTTNTPVMISSASNQTTLRYDCYHGGNLVPVYNGTQDVLLAIGSCEITDAMASSGTGVLDSTNVFDIWAVNISGTLTLCVATNGSGGGWASDTGGSNTARGTGYTELDTTTRPYITNKNALSDCYNGSTNEGSISANEATYLGTFYTNAAGEVSYTFPTIASTPGAGLFGIWNYYNRVKVSATVGDTTSDWTYGSTTVREIHGDTTAIVQYVIGVAEDAQSATSIESVNAGSTGFAGGGICHNSTSSYSGIAGVGPSGSIWGSINGNFATTDLGFNYMAQCESVNAADTQTFYGSPGANNNGTGMTFTGMF